MKIKIFEEYKPESKYAHENGYFYECFGRWDKRGEVKFYTVALNLLHTKHKGMFCEPVHLSINVRTEFPLSNPRHRRRWNLIKEKLLEIQKSSDPYVNPYEYDWITNPDNKK